MNFDCRAGKRVSGAVAIVRLENIGQRFSPPSKSLQLYRIS